MSAGWCATRPYACRVRVWPPERPACHRCVAPQRAGDAPREAVEHCLRVPRSMIDAAEAERMTTTHTDRTRRPFVMDEGVALLARTPGTLDAMLRGLPDGWVGANEGDNSWSPFDVVGHLIHGERTDWMPRVRIVLEHGEKRAFDTFDRLAQFAASEGRPLSSLLDEFATLRQDNLRDLATLRLTDADLDRRGRPVFGPAVPRHGWPSRSRGQISRAAQHPARGRGQRIYGSSADNRDDLCHASRRAVTAQAGWCFHFIPRTNTQIIGTFVTPISHATTTLRVRHPYELREEFI